MRPKLVKSADFCADDFTRGGISRDHITAILNYVLILVKPMIEKRFKNQDVSLYYSNIPDMHTNPDGSVGHFYMITRRKNDPDNDRYILAEEIN
jgi:hypothetical protein